MTRTMTAISDRLLGMLVPQVVAHADPCGVRKTVHCFCSGGFEYTKRCCTASGVCSACVKGLRC